MAIREEIDRFRNQCFNEDVLSILRKIPDNRLDMIYGDPDYNVGINYSGKKYTMRWMQYIDWYAELTEECMRVLKPEGNLFMINYPKQNAWLRVKYLDANAHKVHDYVWIYNTNVGHSPRKFTTAHRSILHATKSANNAFYKENVAVPYKNPTDRRIRERIAAGNTGRMPYSWFYFNLVKNTSRDKKDHPCQIPLPLFKMLLKASTREKDDVFILFGGGGNEIEACRKLKRNYISCEIHPEYHGKIVRET
jgi:site-specific DNA-methyltransferase (adenine-specific)